MKSFVFGRDEHFSAEIDYLYHRSNSCLTLDMVSIYVTEMLVLIIYSFICLKKEIQKGEERKVSQNLLTDEQYASMTIYTCRLRENRREKKRKG